MVWFIGPVESQNDCVLILVMGIAWSAERNKHDSSHLSQFFDLGISFSVFVSYCWI
jgi:hypothetical protein